MNRMTYPKSLESSPITLASDFALSILTCRGVSAAVSLCPQVGGHTFGSS
jgi:hypothetical protein